MHQRLRSAPTVVYPESDGQPMAETPRHQQVMIDCMNVLKRHFYKIPEVYIGGNMLLYYEEGNPPEVCLSGCIYGSGGLEERTPSV